MVAALDQCNCDRHHTHDRVIEEARENQDVNPGVDLLDEPSPDSSHTEREQQPERDVRGSPGAGPWPTDRDQRSQHDLGHGKRGSKGGGLVNESCQEHHADRKTPPMGTAAYLDDRRASDLIRPLPEVGRDAGQGDESVRPSPE